MHKYVFLAFLDDPTMVLLPIITLISLSGALSLSSTGQLGSGSLGGFSPFLTNRYNFPCLMNVLICCLRSLHSEVSCPWSGWKWQYLFLGLLFGLPFSLSNQVNVASSFIYMRTCSSGVFRGVKFVVLLNGDLDLLSSLLSFVQADFLPRLG